MRLGLSTVIALGSSLDRSGALTRYLSMMGRGPVAPCKRHDAAGGLPKATAQRRAAFGPLLRCEPKSLIGGTMYPHRASPRTLHWAKIGSVTAGKPGLIWL